MTIQTISNVDQFTNFPGGVKAAVLRMNGSDMIHHAALGDVLHESIGQEAAAHDASIDDDNFKNVLSALESQTIHAYFLVVSWENCRRKIAGGATEFPTVITEWDGSGFKHYPATHGEDSYVLPLLSKEFRQRTADEQNPRGAGLGTFFMRERIRLAVTPEDGSSPYGMISRGRVAEYSAHSTAMVSLLTALGATLGKQDQGTILQLDGLPSELVGRRRLAVRLEGLGRHEGDILSNVFVASWSGDNGAQIAASFTEAISTFSGQPIVRVQFTTNHRIPDDATLMDALASLIMAGHAEVLLRKGLSDSNAWKVDEHRTVMRIHALNEPEIGNALRKMGAAPRMIGPHFMRPVITNFGNIPDKLLDFPVPKATPLFTTPLSHASGRFGHKSAEAVNGFTLPAESPR